MVLTDVDGTIADARGRVGAHNARAAATLARAGVQVHLATGRSPASVSTISEQMPCASTAILLNGALVADIGSGLVHRRRDLESSAIATVLAAIDPLPSVAALTYTEDGITVVRDGPGLADLFRRDGVTPAHSTSFAQVAQTKQLKLLLIVHPDELSTLAQTVRRAAPQVTLIRSEPGYLEVLAPGTDKGVAAATLLDMLDHRTPTVVAMGNGPNDLPLLGMGDVSLFPDGSHDDVRRPPHLALGAPAARSLTRLCALLGLS